MNFVVLQLPVDHAKKEATALSFSQLWEPVSTPSCRHRKGWWEDSSYLCACNSRVCQTTLSPDECTSRHDFWHTQVFRHISAEIKENLQQNLNTIIFLVKALSCSHIGLIKWDFHMQEHAIVSFQAYVSLNFLFPTSISLATKPEGIKSLDMFLFDNTPLPLMRKPEMLRG